jgi:hypothetical protein
MIDAFPEPYPTTEQSYRMAFGKAAHPTLPDDFRPAYERTCTFWEYAQRFREAKADAASTGDGQTSGEATPRYT